MFLQLAVVFCLQAPVAGDVVEPYGPVGRFGGHWGIVLAAQIGTPVRAAGSGRVSFAGSVAGMLSVTIDHGGGLRSSVSYLSTITVGQGNAVVAGATLGFSGRAHGREALHLSVRVDGRYTDPHPYLLCGAGDPTRLYLLPPPDQVLR
ncbi:MAG: murein hydrolase activator EnvC family protein, partial [Acidimicrobiia bacterium]